MRNPFFPFFHLLDEFMLSFHWTALALGYCVTLGLQSVCIHFFEPVTTVAFSFLLTFPLTTGMTIIFLILFNMNWKKITFIEVVATPAMFGIFFIFLNAMSDRLQLPKKLDKYKKELARNDSMNRVTDSMLLKEKYQEAARTRRQELYQEYLNLHQKSNVDTGKLIAAIKDAGNSWQPKKPSFITKVVTYLVGPSSLLYK
jgi:ABC-type bacteriocin/lantibiotic exporter with double-glycine peptidase domain